MKNRVFVIDDHALMRRTIVEAIEREPDLVVCGQAEDAAEALTAIVRAQPDLVLTDIQLKSSSGFDVIKGVRTQSPTLPIVATSMFDASRNERLARAAGASSFVSKQDGPARLVATVQHALRQGQSPEQRASTEA